MAEIAQEAKGRSADLPRLLSELRTVVGGYVAIATKVPTQEHRKGATFAQMGLARSVDAVTGKTSVPVLSLPVAPRPDAVYEGLPYVAKVLPNIKFVGGVHAPKCIDVVDSHGQVGAYHVCSRAFKFTSGAGLGVKFTRPKAQHRLAPCTALFHRNDLGPTCVVGVCCKPQGCRLLSVHARSTP